MKNNAILRAVVVDDIAAIRENTIELLKKHCPNVVVIGEADTVAGGVAIIHKFLPDLVFLDVEMPDGSGFDLLQQLSPLTFKVIFISGYQDFAIRAFRFSALDYLLKPINPIDLTEAVNRANESLSREIMDMKLSSLFLNMASQKGPQKIILRTSEKLYSVNIDDIVHCEGEGNYTTFHFINAPKLVVSTKLKEYESTLSGLGFFRSHQSHLVNMLYFDHYSKGDGGIIVLKDKSAVPLATRKKEEFMELLRNYDYRP